MQKPLKFTLRVPTDELVEIPCRWLHGSTETFVSVAFCASLEAWRKAGAVLLSGEIKCHQDLTDALKRHAIERSRQGWTEEFDQAATEDLLTDYDRQLALKDARLMMRAQVAAAAKDEVNDDGAPAPAPAPVAKAPDPLPSSPAPIAKAPAPPARRVKVALRIVAPLDEPERQASAPQRPAPAAPPLDDDARRHPRTLRLGSMPVGRSPFPLPAKRATREPQPPQRPRTITASEMLVDIDPDATARGSSTRVRLAQLAVCALVTIGGLYSTRSGPTPAPSRAAMPLSAPAATPAPSSAAMPLTPPAVEQQRPQEPEEPVELDTAEDTAPEATRQSTPSESTMRRKRRIRLRARNARRKAQRAAAAAAAAAANNAEAPRQQEPATDNESTIGRALHSVRRRESALIRAIRQTPEKEIAPRNP